MKEYCMYDFVPNIVELEKKEELEGLLNEENNEVNQSIYDILLSYLPQLNGNFDTWNLVSKLNTLYKEENTKKSVCFSDYFSQILNWLRVSLNPSISVPNRNEIISTTFSEEQKTKLLNRLIDISKEDSNCFEFSTINEFLDYALNCVLNENPINEIHMSLIDLILKIGINIASKNSKLELRYDVITAYVTEVGRILRDTLAQDKIEEDNSEIERFKFIESVLSSKIKFLNYEKFLEEYNQRITTFALQTMKQMSLSAKRDEYVRQEILQGLTTAKRRAAQKTSIEQVLYGDENDIELPDTDSIEWHIEAYDMPQVLCDEYTNYSELPELKQRVIAVSYGRFHYKMGKLNNKIVQPEIVGVTRIGTEGVSNYFAVVPLDDVSFKSADDLQESEVSDSIVNLLFSDYNMKNAKLRNNFYVGTILIKNGIPVLNAQNTTDKEALYQATQKLGDVSFVSPNGSKTEGKMTLDNYLSSNALETLHYSILSARINNKNI